MTHDRTDIELVAMRLFETSKFGKQPGGLHWYSIGLQRRAQWRRLAISILDEPEPSASDADVEAAWEELAYAIPNDLGLPRMPK